MHPPPPSRAFWLTAAAVLAVLLAAYAPAFAFPYAHDDWEKLRWHDLHTDWGERLATYFNPQGRLFYRPLSALAAGLLHAGWPDDPRAYHVVNLLLLAVAALAAGALVHTLTGQARTGRLVALLFAAATPVHLETQFWLVGVNDLAMVPLTFAALRLHLRGRPGAAAAAWAAALLFKESAVFVPVVAAAATLLRLDTAPAPAAAPRARWLRLWPFVAVGLIYLALKLAGTLPTRVPADHPYAIEVARSTVGPRIGDYARWLLHGLLPALAGWTRWDRLLQGVAAHPLPLHALVWGALAGTLWLARRRDRTQGARAALAWFWILCSLGPLLLLPNQAARYYLVTALPAALWLLLLAVESLGPPAGARPGPRALGLALFIGLSAAGGVAYARARTAEGLEQRFTDGTNHPIARGTATRIVQAQVRALWPQLPRGAFVVFQNLDVYGFGPGTGLRRWYDDPTLIACPDGPLRGQPALLAQAATARAEGRLRVARWDGERLLDVTAAWEP